jgi:hypothetical protein
MPSTTQAKGGTMIPQDRGQSGWPNPDRPHDLPFRDDLEPLPRFDTEEPVPDLGHTGAHSLIPMASDVTDEERPRPVSPVVRQARAFLLFLVLVVPVMLLIVFEVVTVGAAWLRQPDATSRIEATQALAGRVVGGAQQPLTEDQARDAASKALEGATYLASASCAEPGAPPVKLWVVVTVTEDGSVASMAVEGPTQSRPYAASCVGGIVRRMHVPAFRGPPVTASRELTLW